MAIVVESTSSASNSTGSHTSLVITKPTGLAVGDLMIAVCESYGGTDIRIDTISGWTSVITTVDASSNVNTAKIQYKIADSGDVAASDFTFNLSGDVGSLTGGSILRVTGHAVGSIVAASETDQNASASSATLSFTASSSAISDGSLILMCHYGVGASVTGTLGSYIASDGSLSWTELHDYTKDVASDDPIIGAAYAIQTTTTALTSYGATFSTTKTHHESVLAIFTALRNATGTNALLSVSPTTFTQAGSAGTTGTNTLLSVSPTLQTQSGESSRPTVWTAITKT